MDIILLSDYLRVIKKNIALFILLTLIGVVIGYALPKIIPVTYTSSLDFYVRHKTQTSPLFYTYDGYYSTQSSVDFTQTVAGFLESLSTVANASQLVIADPSLKQLNVNTSNYANADYLQKFQKNISVKITAPQIVHLSITDPNKQVSIVWTNAIENELLQNLKILNEQGDSNFSVDAISSPITTENIINKYILMAVGGLLGIFLSFIIGFARDDKKNH